MPSEKIPNFAPNLLTEDVPMMLVSFKERLDVPNIRLPKDTWIWFDFYEKPRQDSPRNYWAFGGGGYAYLPTSTPGIPDEAVILRRPDTAPRGYRPATLDDPPFGAYIYFLFDGWEGFRRPAHERQYHWSFAALKI